MSIARNNAWCTLRESSFVARVLFVLFQVSALTTCGGSDTAVAPATSAPRLWVRIDDGESQAAFVGELLERPVVVQLADSLGRPIADQRHVQFSIVRGGGAVSQATTLTTAGGRATVRWQLGPERGTQQLAVNIAEQETPPTPTVVVNARALADDEGDLVVISGLKSGAAGVVIQEDRALEARTLQWPDTILRLLPRVATGSWQQVTAFSVGHPPEARIHPWTDRIDTIKLTLRDPIDVPFTIWAVLDYDTTAAKAQLDLADLDYFWRTHAIGLRVGTVKVKPAPEARNVVSCNSDTHGYVDSGVINVYYAASVAEVGGYGAINCSPAKIVMGPGAPLGFRTSPNYLFTHEVGHALSLDHLSVTGNVMRPEGPWLSGVTFGQIYWMHFDAGSALNAIFGIHPAAERNCRTPLALLCPSQDYTVW